MPLDRGGRWPPLAGWTAERISGARGNIDFIVTEGDEKLVALDRNGGGVFVKSFDYSDTISSAAIARDVALAGLSQTQLEPSLTNGLFTAGSGVPQGIYLFSRD